MNYMLICINTMRLMPITLEMKYGEVYGIYESADANTVVYWQNSPLFHVPTFYRPVKAALPVSAVHSKYKLITTGLPN